MKIRDEYTCPLEIVHDFIKGKWKTIIIFQLSFGNTSLSKLRRDIAGISEKMLLQQLNELRKYGMVDKISGSGYPLHVEYFLTERGKKIASAVFIMQDIGIDYMVEHGHTDWLDKKGIKYQKCN
jgi:DNA-binding HxlR family transcriptional regulator